MLRPQPPPLRGLRRLRDLAEGQWGLLTRAQVEASGVAWSTLSHLAKVGDVERVAHGVYRVRGTAEPDHLALRAAWLQLDPATPAWGRLDAPAWIVSHASAADLFGAGDLNADILEFTGSARRQTRRPDVKLHRGSVARPDWILLHGLPVTRAGRLVRDLLASNVELPAVAQVTADVIDRVLDYPAVVAAAISPYAPRFDLKRGDGPGLLELLLDEAGYRDRRAQIRRETIYE